MYSILRIFFLFLVVSLCNCNQNNRTMWEPSQAYIGVEPNDDAPVKSGADSMTNYAQDKTLRIEHGKSVAYLKFFTPGFSKLDSAILHVQTKFVQSAGSISVYEVLNKDWDETEITWSNRPEIGKKPIASLMCDENNKIYEFDLTEHVIQKISAGKFYICLCFRIFETVF